MINVTENNIEELLKSEKAIIKYSATWCGPCRALAKTLGEIEPNHSDIKFFEADVDENDKLASMMGIRSIPVMNFYKNGEMVKSIIGAVKKEEIEKTISEIF